MTHVDAQVAAICSQYGVSRRQAEVVIAKGDCVVVACPGSGKTRTVGTRLAHRLNRWENYRQGIAVISFTNVAAEEIANRLESLQLPRALPFPHFLGTINAFFDRFLFMPHGHRVMRPKLEPKKPRLVLPHNEDWVNDTFTSSTLKQKGKSICDFHYQVDGTLIYNSPEGLGEVDRNLLMQAARDKRKMAHSGYATHSDSMYWSLKLVETYPEIARAVAGRFAEVIIDEFQDTSQIQLEVLKILLAGNTSTLMLVGDPNQSIYGFNSACPEVLLRPEQTFSRLWPRVRLTDNYRSSQLICNATCWFRSHCEPDHSSGSSRDFGTPPLVFKYADKNVAETIEVYTSVLEKFDVPVSESVVLTWKNSTVRRLRGGTPVKKFPGTIQKHVRRLAEASYLRDLRDWPGAYEGVKCALLALIFDQVDYLPFQQELGDLMYRQWRQGVGFLLDQLPAATCTLGEWLKEGRAAFAEFQQRFPWQCKKSISLGRIFPSITSKERHYAVSEFFEAPVQDLVFDVKTIHQAKGESHTATMVVCSPQLRRNSPSDVYDWFSEEVVGSELRSEEVRRAFVALTRPRKLLCVAVPESAWSDTLSRFLECGFVEA